MIALCRVPTNSNREFAGYYFIVKKEGPGPYYHYNHSCASEAANGIIQPQMMRGISLVIINLKVMLL